MSLTDSFRSWLYYLDNGYLQKSPYGNDVRIVGTDKVSNDGVRDAWDVVRELWPAANPVTLTVDVYESENVDFLRRLRAESGFTDHHELEPEEVWQLYRRTWTCMTSWPTGSWSLPRVVGRWVVIERVPGNRD